MQARGARKFVWRRRVDPNLHAGLLKTQVPHLRFKQGIGVYYFFVSQRHGNGPAAQVANLPES